MSDLRACDICREEWEPEFFCPICSEEPHIETHRVPDLMWSYDPADDEYLDEEAVVYHPTCFNCCPGHGRALPGEVPDGI